MIGAEWIPVSHWDDHPDYPVEDWQTEVKNGDTRQSYVSWVNTQIEIHSDEEGGTA